MYQELSSASSYLTNHTVNVMRHRQVTAHGHMTKFAS